jgi:hypothetical protein
MSRSWARHALAAYLACTLGSCTAGCSSSAFDLDDFPDVGFPDWDGGLDAGNVPDWDGGLPICDADVEDCGPLVDFVCLDGKGIAAEHVCDGFPDCEAGEDEDRLECEPTYGETFQCDDGQIIPVEWQCDFFDDCSGGEDERDCPEPFVCHDGSQIPHIWVCDAEEDCDGGEDEVGCELGDGGADAGASDAGVDGGDAASALVSDGL